MSRVKEPHYFTRILPLAIPTIKGERDYLELFANAGGARYRGEASPTYMADPISPPEIQRVSPDARIVISLREPIARVHSHYWHLIRYGVKVPSLPGILRPELEEAHPYWEAGIIRVGFYPPLLERWFEHFGRERVHVMVFEEFAANPRSEVRRIFEVLGVDATPAD